MSWVPVRAGPPRFPSTSCPTSLFGSCLGMPPRIMPNPARPSPTTTGPPTFQSVRPEPVLVRGAFRPCPLRLESSHVIAPQENLIRVRLMMPSYPLDLASRQAPGNLDRISAHLASISSPSLPRVRPPDCPGRLMTFSRPASLDIDDGSLKASSPV